MTRQNPINPKQTIAVHQSLQRYLRKLSDNTFEYTNGQSDQTIANQHKCGRSAVERVRKSLFGEIKPKTAYGFVSKTRIDGLEALVLKQAEDIEILTNNQAELSKSFNALAEAVRKSGIDWPYRIDANGIAQ